jgi:hypothetical protein
MWKASDTCDPIKDRIHTFYEIREPFINRDQQLDARRMGPPGIINVYIVFRGSHTNDDWKDIDSRIVAGDAVFFDKRINIIEGIIPDIQNVLLEKLQGNAIYTVNMYSCGHSLGGFLALMAAFKSVLNGVLFKTKTKSGGNIICKYKSTIIPVVFNPFCGWGVNTMNIIKCIPLGYVYHVYDPANTYGLFTDQASLGLVTYISSTHLYLYKVQNRCGQFQKSQRVFSNSIYNRTNYKYKNTIDGQTAAHLMHNFIGENYMSILLNEKTNIVNTYTKLNSYRNFNGDEFNRPHADKIPIWYGTFLHEDDVLPAPAAPAPEGGMATGQRRRTYRKKRMSYKANRK